MNNMGTTEVFSWADIWAYAEANRERIRTLVGSLLNVAGMLLSALLVLLFFAAENQPGRLPGTMLLLSGTSVLLVVTTMGCSILALMPGRAKPMPTREVALDVVLTRYHQERVLATVASLALLGGIFASLATFGAFFLAS